MTSRILCLLMATLLILSGQAFSEESPKPLILLTAPSEAMVPSEVKNEWLAALILTYFEMRFAGLSGVNCKKAQEFLPHDTYPLGAAVPEEKLLELAGQIKADFILKHLYELEDRGESIHYLLEISRVQDKSIEFTFEESFDLKSLESTLHTCFTGIGPALSGRAVIGTPTRAPVELLGRNRKALSLFGSLFVEKMNTRRAQSPTLLEKFKKGIARYAKPAVALYGAGELSEYQGLHLEAAQYFKQLVQEYHLSYPVFAIRAASNFRKAGAFQEAMDFFAHTDLPLDNQEIPVEQARILLGLTRFKRAQDILLGVHAQDSTRPFVNSLLAETYLHLGEFTKAQYHYVAELQIQGNTEPLLEKISWLSMLTASTEHAKRSATELLAINPANAQGCYALSYAFAAENNVSEARNYLTQAEMLGKPDSGTYAILGAEFASLGENTTAIAVLEKSASAYPTNSRALLQLAQLYESEKQDSLAAVTYANIYKNTSDKTPEHLLKAGALYFSRENHEEARKVYKIFFDNGHRDSQAFIHSALISQSDTQYERALEYLSRLDEKTANSTEVLLIQAKILMTQKKYADALPIVNKLVYRDGNNHQIIELAALCFDENRHWTNAIGLYQKYLTLSDSGLHNEYAHRLAILLERKGRVSQAIAQYRKNIAEWPEDFRNQKHLADTYMRMGKIEEAEQILTTAAARVKAPPDLALQLARLMKRKNDTEMAATWYSAYLNQKPQDSLVWLEYGKMHYAEKQYRKSVYPLRNAAQQMPSNTDLWYQLGYALVESDSFSAAVMPFKKVLATEPHHKNALALSTLCYDKTGDTLQLISNLETQASIDTNTFIVWVRLGELLLAIKEYHRARVYLEEAISLKPDNSPTRLNLIRLYTEIDNQKKRLRHIRLGLKEAPRNYRLQYELAQYFYYHNELDSAAENILATLRLQPRMPEARYVLGLIRLRQNDFGSAFINFEKATTIAPENETYRFQYIKSAVYANKVITAIKEIEEELKRTPIKDSLYLLAGMIYSKIQHDRKAEEFLTEALNQMPDCGFCHEHIGYLWYRKQEYKKAIFHLEKAQMLSPNDSASIRLGDSYHHINEPMKASKAYEHAYSLNPDNQRALYLIATTYMNMGYLGSAQEVITKQKRKALSPWVHCAQGRLLEKQNKPGAAALCYAKAIEIDNTIIDAHAGLGRVLLHEGKYKEALKSFTEIYKRDSTNNLVLTGIAQSKFYMNHLTASQPLFEKLMKTDPSNSEHYFFSALIHKKRKNYTEAIRLLSLALKHEPENARYLFALAKTEELTKEYYDAIDHYDKARKIDDSYELEALKALGNIYVNRLNKKRKGKRYLKKYLSKGGKDYTVNVWLKKLD